MIDRRMTLGRTTTGAAMALACLFAVEASAATPSGQRLRDLAGDFYIGFANMNNFQSASDAATYQQVARTEFNILTPENALKWDALRPNQTTFNFGPADTHLAFAQANGMAFHGHVLVWHSQNPSWLANGSWTASTLTAVLNEHIDTVMAHYRGQVLVWDVVNEAFNDGDGSRRASIWQNTLGNGYIEQAFRRARAADPTAKLIYNDYNIETIGAKSNAVYAMAQDFVNRGVPIDGIGMQAHLTSGGISGQSFADNMARFAALGLEIYITELDIRYPTPISASDLQAQATHYRTVMDRCLAQPMCKAVQPWGFTDKYSWVPNTFSGQGDALIFDANYNAKPAYFAIQAALGGGTTPTPTSRPTATPTTRPTATPTTRPTATPTTRPTVTATPTNTPSTSAIYQAESASLGGGTTVESNHAGFAGTGFVNFPATGGFAQFTVDGMGSGSRTLRFRFALGASGSRTGQLQVNGGTAQSLTFNSTGAWSAWATVDVPTTLVAGNNTVRVQSSGQDLANLDQLEVLMFGGTPTPTSRPTATPTATPTGTSRPTATPTTTPTPGGTACANPTTVSMPITRDGVADVCLFTTGTIANVNSWNTQLVTINGATFTNTWSNSMPARVDGGYYIRYVSTVAWGHFEAR